MQKRRPTAVEVLDAIREAAARLRRQKEEARQQAIKAAERSRRILEANEKAKGKPEQKQKRKKRKRKEEPFTIDPSRLQLKNAVNLPCEHRVCMCNVNGYCGHRTCPTGQRIIPKPNN